MKDKNKNLTATEKLAAKTEGFFSRNYRLLIIIAAVILVAVVVIAIVTITGRNRDEAIATDVYNLELHYNALLLLDPESSDYSAASAQIVSDANAILSQADAGDYAAVKTQYILGLYYAGEEDWTTALGYFETAAEAANGTYLGSLSLANAAAMAENNGDQNTALAYYNRIWDDYGHDAAESPKALFNAARIYEAQGDTELAVATYSQLADEFVSSEYAQLANARLIVLE